MCVYKDMFAILILILLFCVTAFRYEWVGLDISEAMLNVAVQREPVGDMCQSDMGQGLFFRNGVFDGAVSVQKNNQYYHVFALN